MTSTISKFKQVKITLVDICQCYEAWTPENEILDHDVAVCTDVGYIYKKTRDKLWLFTSYSEDEYGFSVGGLTCIPTGVIKKIKVIK